MTIDIHQQVRDLCAEVGKITGQDPYGYTAEPSPGSLRLTFQDGTVCLSYDQALNHALWLLNEARGGRLPYYCLHGSCPLTFDTSQERNAHMAQRHQS